MSFPYGPHCLEQTAYKPQGILHIPYFGHDHAPEIPLQKMPLCLTGKLFLKPGSTVPHHSSSKPYRINSHIQIPCEVMHCASLACLYVSSLGFLH